MNLERIWFQALEPETELSQRIKLYKAFYNLSKNLRDNWLDFDTIIADDASGRLVGLFVWHLINLARADNNLDPAKMLFIAGGRDLENPNNIKQNISNFFQFQNIQNALIVTEFAESGKSIQSLKRILAKNQIPAQAAALSIRYKNDTLFSIVDFCGDFENEIALIFNISKLNGVTKIQNSPQVHTIPNYYNPQKIRQSRTGIKLLAQHIYAELQNS